MKLLRKVRLRNMAASLRRVSLPSRSVRGKKNGYRLITRPTETTNEDTRMRGSTRIDAGQRKKTDVELCREKMQNSEVVGNVHRQKLVKNTCSR